MLHFEREVPIAFIYADIMTLYRESRYDLRRRGLHCHYPYRTVRLESCLETANSGPGPRIINIMKQQRMIQSTTLICGALSMALRCLQNGANVDAFSVARHHRVPRRHHIALMEGSQPRSELTDWVIAGLEGTSLFYYNCERSKAR